MTQNGCTFLLPMVFELFVCFFCTAASFFQKHSEGPVGPHLVEKRLGRMTGKVGDRAKATGQWSVDDEQLCDGCRENDYANELCHLFNEMAGIL